MKKKINNWQSWQDTKKKLGWQVVHGLVPAPLAIEIKELMRKWKYENPEHYIKK